MKFSLVTTCLNEMQSLPQWRHDLKAQTRSPDEIVIVDAVSKDGTTEFLQEWAHADPRVKIRVERCNVARGRNLAIGLAAHEHIVSTDMGVRLDARWFEEIVRPFEEDPSVEVVVGSSGSIDPLSVASPAARAEYYLTNGGSLRLGPGSAPNNRSSAYTKKVWRELGGLPEDLTFAADDSVFGRQVLRAGYKIAYAPEAVVYWCRHQRLRAFWKESYNYGRGDGEANIRTPLAVRLCRRGLLPRVLVPLVMALRRGSKQVTFQAVGRALQRGDFIACVYMLPFVFGKEYAYAKGYLVGDAYGAVHCQGCRRRLQ